MPSAKVRLRDLVRTHRQMRRTLEARGPDASQPPPPDLVCRPILVGTAAGVGERGCLVLSRGRLVAVVVRLGKEEDAHQQGTGTEIGSWFLEAGFGSCDPGTTPPQFGTLWEALGWVRRRLARDTAGTAQALRAAFDYAQWLHGDTDRMLTEVRSALAEADRLLAEQDGSPDGAGPD